MNRFFGVLVRTVLISSWASAETVKRALELADMHRLYELAEPRISPDGEWIAFVARFHNMRRDASQSRVWLVGYDGTRKQELNEIAEKEQGESQWAVQWGPEGHVYYLSDRGDSGPQIWRQDIGKMQVSGEAKQITHQSGGVGDFVVSPDGRRLAIIAADPLPKIAEGMPALPLVTERFQFMEGDDGVFLDDRRSHLYVVDVQNGETTLLTTGAHDEWLPSWSPDGRSIAYVSKRGNDPDRTIDFNIFVVDAQAGAVERQVTDYPGSDLNPYWGSRPAWSPDGKRIAYLRSGAPKWLDYAPPQLAIVELDTRAVSQPAMLDRFFYTPHWSVDGRSIYALREEAEATHLVKVDLDSNTLHEITSGKRFEAGFDLGRDGKLVVLGNDSSAPYEIFAVETNLRLLTAMNAGVLADIQIQPVEDLRFRSADGTEIHGLLVKPRGYQTGKRYPTIVRLHGGPVYQFSHEFMFDWQWLAAQGYAVLGINPRGSSGRGFDFSRAIYADWGKLDVADVLAGVDHLVNLGIADPDRLGVGGHSYGSILTNYVIASDTRFKAATSSSGGNNSFALYGLDMYAREYEIELGTPWKNPDVYARISYPFLHADRITTPTLFLCGADDFNVPCAGAQQMYQALRSLKVPTRFIRFPKQGHTLDVPSYLEFRLKSYGEWYERFVGR